jgi:signal peptidase II
LGERLKRLAIVALVVVGLDQLTKALAVHYLSPLGGYTIIPGIFDLRLAFNQGAAFSLFSGWPQAHWLLAGISVVALGVAIWIVLGRPGRNRTVQVCIGLICGGAVSNNLIDRLRLGRVIDFMDLHAGDLHWPTFNLADSAITLGGLYLAWLLLRGKV